MAFQGWGVSGCGALVETGRHVIQTSRFFILQLTRVKFKK